MNKKIKIAHIQLLPLMTGVQRVSLDELNNLDSKKFEKYMVCQTQGPMTDECEKQGVHCFYSPNLVREISPIKDIKSFFHLFKLFRLHKFDIVHTHSSKTGVIGRLAAKLAGVSMVVHTVHGYAFPAAKNKRQELLFKAMEWVGTKCSDKIICLHDIDKHIAQTVLGAKESQLCELPNGIDVKKFSPAKDYEKAQTKKELGLPENSYVVGMVGRLWEQKNPQSLLTAALNILDKRDDIYFLFVGDGELRSSLEKQVTQASKRKNIRFLGWREDTPNILKSLDIFVLPSRWEGMPLAILEAQGSGLPCIVSNIPGNNHLVRDMRNGMLFDLDDNIKLSQNISKLVDNEDLRDQFGKFSREAVLKNHNIDERIQSISKLYHLSVRK